MIGLLVCPEFLVWCKRFGFRGWLWFPQRHILVPLVEALEKVGIIDRYDYFAVGNLCVRFNTKIIHESAKIARNLLPDKQLHIFGLKLKAVPYVAPFIDSFDSLAWTRPVDKSVMVKGTTRYIGWSCKTSEERFRFFMAWLNRLNNYLTQKNLLEFLGNEKTI